MMQGVEMPTEIETIDKVPEGGLRDLIRDFAQDDAATVTAINDGAGTFTVEATFPDTPPQASVAKSGKMSVFGGPEDTVVAADEGLALFEPVHVPANKQLFLDAQPPGTTGLARRLNPEAKYLACRWEYAETPKDFLREITVKVSNPANGKSEVARPVDWGPHISTGRVADLSPALARALGLNTDDVCNLEVPLPGAGVAVGIDLAALDNELFPVGMTRTLVAMTTSNNTTYWVVKQVGQVEGGQSLMRRIGQNPPKILRSDTTILPLEADDDVPAAVAAELNKAVRPEPPFAEGTGGSPGANLNATELNSRVFAATTAFVGTSTRDVPLTEQGNLACAWAVNQVVRIALGKPISTIGGGKNGLATAEMFGVLKARHTRLGSINDVTPGTLVISPTVGGRHGHVGIVGKDPPGGGVDNMQIFSNSSRNARFEQNLTIKSWMARYAAQLGLQVEFFNLKRDQF
jgi:hypothetical protein